MSEIPLKKYVFEFLFEIPNWSTPTSGSAACYLLCHTFFTFTMNSTGKCIHTIFIVLTMECFVGWLSTGDFH